MNNFIPHDRSLDSITIPPGMDCREKGFSGIGVAVHNWRPNIYKSLGDDVTVKYCTFFSNHGSGVSINKD